MHTKNVLSQFLFPLEEAAAVCLKIFASCLDSGSMDGKKVEFPSHGISEL